MRRADGFTLIELVIVMIVISVGLLGLAGAFSNASSSLSANETLQQAAQYAQECAESAMATRRDLGFDWFSTNTFSCGSNPSGFIRTLNPVGAIYTGVSSGSCNSHNPCPCPNGISCRDVDITVTKGSLYSSISIMLVDY